MQDGVYEVVRGGDRSVGLAVKDVTWPVIMKTFLAAVSSLHAPRAYLDFVDASLTTASAPVFSLITLEVVLETWLEL